MKRSLFFLWPSIFDSQSINAGVNCDSFMLPDGHAFTLLKLVVNTADNFCMELPVMFSVSFCQNIRSIQESDHEITKIRFLGKTNTHIHTLHFLSNYQSRSIEIKNTSIN